MIELVFVIVILGVLAAVAVPRFVATRTDAQVATARSDLASAQKAIVAKVFADNIDATQSKAPDPNKPASAGYDWGTWGKWILNVAGLDGSRWTGNGGKVNEFVFTVKPDDAIQPLGNVKGGKKGGCGAVLGIATVQGALLFAPNNIGGTHVDTNPNNFCYTLKKSFENSQGAGNKIIPLASGGTVEF